MGSVARSLKRAKIHSNVAELHCAAPHRLIQCDASQEPVPSSQTQVCRSVARAQHAGGSRRRPCSIPSTTWMPPAGRELSRSWALAEHEEGEEERASTTTTTTTGSQVSCCCRRFGPVTKYAQRPATTAAHSDGARPTNGQSIRRCCCRLALLALSLSLPSAKPHWLQLQQQAAPRKCTHKRARFSAFLFVGRRCLPIVCFALVCSAVSGMTARRTVCLQRGAGSDSERRIFSLFRSLLLPKAAVIRRP